MSEANLTTNTEASCSPQWLDHSNRSLISILNNYFEDKSPPRPSSFYRFYWFCCHHPKGTLLCAPVCYHFSQYSSTNAKKIQSKLQCLLRNPLLETRCRRCGHRICDTCERIAQQETVDLDDHGQGLNSVPEDVETTSST